MPRKATAIEKVLTQYAIDNANLTIRIIELQEELGELKNEKVNEEVDEDEF